MSAFKTGDFDRDMIPKLFHPFTPAHAAPSLHEVDLKRLWDFGKRLILLDVDHTLVRWKTEHFTDPILEWVEEAKTMGFDICIISNTNHPERVQRLATRLGVETVRGRFKPSRAMFRLALIKFKHKPEQAIMIGDQLLTDVLGANRSGIDAIWVEKMEGDEFGGTKINRKMERLLTSQIYKALIVPIDEPFVSVQDEMRKPVQERTIVAQLIKFAIVGGSAFALDYMIRMTLLFAVKVNGHPISDSIGASLRNSLPSLFGLAKENREAFFPIAAAIAASVAIIWSFFLNRLWTFQIRGKQERGGQFKKFLFVSIIGMILNVLISTSLNHVIQGDPKMSARIATVGAAFLVAFWNFVGQRFYAFRNKQ